VLTGQRGRADSFFFERERVQKDPEAASLTIGGSTNYKEVPKQIWNYKQDLNYFYQDLEKVTGKTDVPMHAS
jgi:hypothetical protein